MSAHHLTAEQRIFIRRHTAAFSQMADPQAARRAVIRCSYAWGIPQTRIASHLGLSVKTVASALHGSQVALNRLEAARNRVKTAERVLAIARGWERAALARLDRV